MGIVFIISRFATPKILPHLFIVLYEVSKVPRSLFSYFIVLSICEDGKVL